MLRRTLALAAALCCAISAQAQSTDTTVKLVPPPARKTVVTFNPFAILATFFTGDIEHAVSSAVTVGASGSFFSGDAYSDYGSLEGKVRYYPNEKVLQGFSIAGALGLASYRETPFIAYDSFGNPITTIGPGSSSSRTTRGAVGMDLSYQWLLGPKRRFVTVLGAGVKRFLGRETYRQPFGAIVIPTARVNIGFAF